MKLLHDIADIQPGYVFRSGIEEQPDGRFSVLQIKDLTQDELTVDDGLVKTNLFDVKPEHYVREGDVLFGSRGSRKPVAFVAATPPDTVYTYQIYAIRSGSTALPQFLAWYLNQPAAQGFIDENSRGSYITSVSRKDLGRMPVPLPPLNVQRRIVAIQELGRREDALLEQIKQVKRNLVDAVTWKLIKRSEDK